MQWRRVGLNRDMMPSARNLIGSPLKSNLVATADPIASRKIRMQQKPTIVARKNNVNLSKTTGENFALRMKDKQTPKRKAHMDG